MHWRSKEGGKPLKRYKIMKTFNKHKRLNSYEAVLLFPQASYESIARQLNEAHSQVTVSKEISIPFALIIDGKSLGFALSRNLENLFLDLAIRCASVICCRTSPKQKAMVGAAFSIFKFFRPTSVCSFMIQEIYLMLIGNQIGQGWHKKDNTSNWRRGK